MTLEMKDTANEPKFVILCHKSHLNMR